MKKAIKRAAIPCTIYWGILLTMILFLNIATEEWLILVLLLFIIFRLMLWCSPLILSAMCWISGRLKPVCAVKDIALTNVLVLLLNVIPFYLWYLTSGGWY